MTENHKEVMMVIVTGQCVSMSHTQASAASHLHLHQRALLGAGWAEGSAAPQPPPFSHITLCLPDMGHKMSSHVWSHCSCAENLAVLVLYF